MRHSGALEIKGPRPTIADDVRRCYISRDKIRLNVQAARTRVKKLATLVSRSFAHEDRRAVHAVMSSTAATFRVTASSTELISVDACAVWPAAVLTLSAISRVVAPCCCTAAAML